MYVRYIKYMGPREQLSDTISKNISNITLDSISDTALSSLYTNTNNSFKELSTFASNNIETNKRVLNTLKEELKQIIDNFKYSERKETNVQGKNSNGDTKVVNVNVLLETAKNLHKAAIEHYIPKEIIDSNLKKLKDVITAYNLSTANVDNLRELAEFKVEYIKIIILMCSKLIPYYNNILSILKDTIAKIDRYTDNELMVGIPDPNVMDLLEYFSTLNFISKEHIETITIALDKIDIEKVMKDKKVLVQATEAMSYMYNNICNTVLQHLKLHSIVNEELKKKALEEEQDNITTLPFVYKKEAVRDNDKIRTKLCALVLLYNDYNFKLKDIEYTI